MTDGRDPDLRAAATTLRAHHRLATSEPGVRREERR